MHQPSNSSGCDGYSELRKSRSSSNQNSNVPILNWKANLTYYKCGEICYLDGEYPHTSNVNASQDQYIKPSVSVLISQVNITLLAANNPTLLPAITVDIPVSFELWHILIEQFYKANQDNKLLKKVVKKIAK